MIFRITSILVGALLGVAMAAAQAKLPQETHNAALRYWMAFAQIKDPPADEGSTELLRKTADREIAWNEGKLGSILDANNDAIQTMQRATKLPECDWGLEYSLGPQAPIELVYKARVLARLNTLYGMRSASKGDMQQAVDTWLAGIRFSQHVSNGGSLIFLLVARTGLLSDLHALTQAAKNRSLNDVQRKQVEAAVRLLPETVFNWNNAWELEAAAIESGWEKIASSSDPAAAYKQLMGEAPPADFVLPTMAPDLDAFRNFMSDVASTLRVAPEAARQRLSALRASEKSLNPSLQRVIPNFEGVNRSRAEIMDDRQQLLQAVAAK